MKNKTRKAILLALILIAIYYLYEDIKFDKYKKCMISNNSIQEIATNYCLQKLK